MRFPAIRNVFLSLIALVLTVACSQPSEKNFEDFDPSNFDISSSIINPWMPLTPGTRFVYEGSTVEDDGTVFPHRVVINVTDMIKVIDGVRSAVTWDLDYKADQLVEAELAFFAVDKDGAVWRMGEYPEEYEDGKLIDNPTWIHGIEEAHAGIAMLADPQKGTPSYSQGWGPAVDWTDRGQVDQMGMQYCVPFDCFDDVLVIAETSKAEKGAYQLKYYARNVGNVGVDWRGKDQTQEKLELVEYRQLSPDELEVVRSQALEMEKSAYENSEDVYGLTSPLEYVEPTTGGSTPMDTSGEGETQSQSPGTALPEVIVYASDLLDNNLFELDFLDNPASPEEKMIGLPNNGDELDPPPENDPHVIFNVEVQDSIPYRCWIHMKVGTPKGKSQANVIWVQFSGAVDGTNQEAFKPGTDSFLTAQGPEQEGWVWVACNAEDSGEPGDLVYFRTDGQVTVRLQAGMEGVGFDQFILSPALYLENPPSVAVIEK